MVKVEYKLMKPKTFTYRRGGHLIVQEDKPKLPHCIVVQCNEQRNKFESIGEWLGQNIGDCNTHWKRMYRQGYKRLDGTTILDTHSYYFLNKEDAFRFKMVWA